jgi:hypothetical protein
MVVRRGGGMGTRPRYHWNRNPAPVNYIVGPRIAAPVVTT